jgi:hypothetical protein
LWNYASHQVFDAVHRKEFNSPQTRSHIALFFTNHLTNLTGRLFCIAIRSASE